MSNDYRPRVRGIFRIGIFVILLLAAVGPVQSEHAGPAVKPDLDVIAPYVPSPNVAGRITIAGSETMKPLLTQLASEFALLQPEIKVAIEGEGSEAGIREFIVGYSGQRRGEKARGGHDAAAQVGMLASSRELTEQEVKAFTARYGYPPLMIPIALDAVAVYVHRDNPLPGLTLQQLDAIFSTSLKRGGRPITTWGALGLQGDWEHKPIRLHGRDKDSGTRRFFELVALAGGSLREEVTEQPGSASEILAIAKDPAAIGYAGIGYQGSFVRTVPLAKEPGDPFIAPSLETVLKGTYPLSRPLLLYVNQPPNGKWRPALLEFLRFVNSREGQAIVAKGKFFPLPAPMIAKNQVLLTGETITASALDRVK
ncbi:PstS family phosphate ABC transporter substrate-binding protein [Candidatus Nitrospira bockiana]